MKIAYINKNFKEGTYEIIDKANVIINEYSAQGFTLTLRQLYYQFVARGLLENSQKSYKNLGSIINDGRLAGEIDWEAIVDRTRNLKVNPHWESPADIVEQCARQFAINKWLDQDYHVEVWIEKEALIGVIEPVCGRWDVPFFACKGYTSQSEQWRAGQRFQKAIQRGQDVIIFHLGDHDPSGIDMTRDNRDRSQMFSQTEGVDVRRLALNMEQVEAHNPPPNPAKMTDSRFSGYADKYGNESWELDALEPAFIDTVCGRWDVPFFACKGYTSQSEQWRAGQRFQKAIQRGQDVIIFHLGDHDPSGIDMTRDNRDRSQMFSQTEGVDVRRLALNMEQVEAHNPPPNPAKMTDSRFSGYADKYGNESWELDALEPAFIDTLIDDSIKGVLNQSAWTNSRDLEEEHRATLSKIVKTLK